MAKRKVEIPKGSWLDQKGQRWMKVVFDVMSGFGGGEVHPSDKFGLHLQLRFRTEEICC